MSSTPRSFSVSETASGVIVSGELDAATSPVLERALEPHLRTAVGGGDVELDVSDVSFIDSSGLRVILTATQVCRDEGGDLVVIGPSDAMKRLFALIDVADDLSLLDRRETERPDVAS